MNNKNLHITPSKHKIAKMAFDGVLTECKYKNHSELQRIPSKLFMFFRKPKHDLLFFVSNEYLDRLFVFLTHKVSKEYIAIDTKTNNPELFIAAVKFLIDNYGVRDVEFSNDYKYIRRCRTIA